MLRLTSPTIAPHEQILAITEGFWHSRALALATELEIAELLADGPLHVDLLAYKTTKTYPPALFRLLRALETVGVFEQVSPRAFANTPASDCLRRNARNSQWAWVRAQLSVGGGVYEAWSRLIASLQTGSIAFDRALGCNLWEYYSRNTKSGAIFNEALRLAGKYNSSQIASAYNWSRFPVIADVGGGVGGLLVEILDAYPSCRGLLFDDPKVLQQAIPHERIQTIGGDFFRSVPAGPDAYILRWIIHDWSEEKTVTLLNNIHTAMKPGGRLILIEEVIPDGAEAVPGKWLDMLMMATTGGRERTEKEYRELLSTGGFELEEVVPTSGPLSILIAKARNHGMYPSKNNAAGDGRARFR